jgi:hypothetical protein
MKHSWHEAGERFRPRAQSHLPDLVAVLHGIVDVEAVAGMDSKRSGIRVSFEETPDAPLSKVIFDFPGGKPDRQLA